MNKDGKNRPRNRLGNKIVILGYVPYTMFDVGVSYFLQKKIVTSTIYYSSIYIFRYFFFLN